MILMANKHLKKTKLRKEEIEFTLSRYDVYFSSKLAEQYRQANCVFFSGKQRKT